MSDTRFFIMGFIIKFPMMAPRGPMPNWMSISTVTSVALPRGERRITDVPPFIGFGASLSDKWTARPSSILVTVSTIEVLSDELATPFRADALVVLAQQRRAHHPGLEAPDATPVVEGRPGIFCRSVDPFCQFCTHSGSFRVLGFSIEVSRFVSRGRNLFLRRIE